MRAVSARAHKRGGWPLGEPFDGSPDRQQRQRPRGFCRPSALRKQMGKLLITVDRPKGIAQLRHQRAFGAEPVDQPTRFFRDWLQAMGFHRHWSPRFLFQDGKPSASQWLHALSLSIADGTCPLVYTKFPNRVIDRAQRRCIGPPWLFRYPDEKVKLHLYPLPIPLSNLQ